MYHRVHQCFPTAVFVLGGWLYMEIDADGRLGGLGLAWFGLDLG